MTKPAELIQIAAVTTDTFQFSRDWEGVEISVVAEWIPLAELWGLTCRLHGEIVDFRQGDDPWADAREMMKDAMDEWHRRNDLAAETDDAADNPPAA